MIDWNSTAKSIGEFFSGTVKKNFDLRELSRWKIGGFAPLVLEPDSVNSVSRLLAYIQANNLPHIVIGEGSNLLFDDKGLNAIVIKIGRKLSNIEINEDLVKCQAGCWAPNLARNCASSGLSGLQHIVGIPGSVGGLIYMNGGSQRKGIGDLVMNVTSVTEAGVIETRSQKDCEFKYRQSCFQDAKNTIVESTLKLLPGDARSMKKEMLKILRSRRKKFPLKLPNCGSVFVSDPAMYKEIGPPGKAIEEVGLKNLSCGDAIVSGQHANFIVNMGNAKSNDVLRLIKDVQNKVFHSTGFLLQSEVEFVSFDCQVMKAHEAFDYKYMN